MTSILFVVVVLLAVGAVGLAVEAAAMRRRARTLARDVRIDEETGLASRELLLERVDAERHRSRRYGRGCWLAMLEVRAGVSLRDAAEVVAGVVGFPAMVGRGAGHSLVVLLPEHSGLDAQRAAIEGALRAELPLGSVSVEVATVPHERSTLIVLLGDDPLGRVA
ncbi:MAG: hypothetical protein JWM98_1954 [Thermoleophilia bacterium]|nr:hypothetical protein [Thermoleophilia bacterium]